MLLSEHFLLEEFVRSETAARLGQPIVIDDPAIQENLRRWCMMIGEPLRAKFGRPIVILSGYRPLWLNQKVGGASNSAHLYGCAADILVPGMTVESVCNAASKSALEYDQVIFEFAQWTHVAIARTGSTPRHMTLTARKAGSHTEYLTGIVPPPQEVA